MLSQPIRLITINTWKCKGNFAERIQSMKEELQKLKPDILLCQEVFQNDEVNTSTLIAEALKMNHIYEPSRYKSRRFGQEMVMSYSGLALLSQAQIEAHDIIPLPSSPDDPERIAQFVIVHFGTIKMLIINTHLTHLPGSSIMRKQQIAAIFQHEVLDHPYNAIWLGGDFNAEEDSEEIQYLMNQKDWQLTDCFRAYTPHAGYTLVNAKGRIDYIFCLNKAGMPIPSITYATIILNHPNAQGLYPSDHFGVMINAIVYGN